MLLGLSKKGELILVINGSQTAGDCVTLMLFVIWRVYAISLVWLTKKGEKVISRRKYTLIWWRWSKK